MIINTDEGADQRLATIRTMLEPTTAEGASRWGRIIHWQAVVMPFGWDCRGEMGANHNLTGRR